MSNLAVMNYCTNSGTVKCTWAEDSNSWTGGIVGEVKKSTVNNCTNTGIITGENWQVGGIAGIANTDSIFNDCTNSGTISGEETNVGGIFGWSSGTTVNRCANYGNVTSNDIYTGGIGGNVNVSTIDGCYNSGTISGTGYVGGIVGRLNRTI